jgi:hypothetical protein
MVVFCWCNRGEMRGKRGQKTVFRTRLKNTPSIPNIFAPLPNLALAVCRNGFAASQLRRLPFNAYWPFSKIEREDAERQEHKKKGGDRSLHL